MSRISKTTCLKIVIYSCICFLLFTSVPVLIESLSGWETKNTNVSLNEILRNDIPAPCSGYGIRNVRNIKKEACKKRLPNCIIIGVQKAGTLALLWFLSSHPQVVRNPEINEYNFFDFKYHKGLDWYKTQMPYSLPGQVVIEKTPTYYRNSEAPARIFKMNPRINLILAVRDPVHRALSDYLMWQRLKERRKKLWRNESFESSWRRYASTYDENFQIWLKYFDKKQIHVVDGDALTANPVKELIKIESFLKIDHYFNDSIFVFSETKGFYCLNKPGSSDVSSSDNIECLFKGKGNLHPNISEAVEKEMRAFFRPHNERFYRLSGRNFDWDTNN